jgi:hypothetical protein
MVECICCQCEEHIGQFRDYIQCEKCQDYGSVDEFPADGQVCLGCLEFEQSQPKTFLSPPRLRLVTRSR